MNQTLILISIILFSTSANGLRLNPNLEKNPMLKVAEDMLNKNLVQCEQFSVEIIRC